MPASREGVAPLRRAGTRWPWAAPLSSRHSSARPPVSGFAPPPGGGGRGGGKGRLRIYLAGRALSACARPDRSMAPSLPGISPSPSSPVPCTSGSLALPALSRPCHCRLARRGSATRAGAEGLPVRPQPPPRSGPGAPSSAAEEPPLRLAEGGGGGLRARRLERRVSDVFLPFSFPHTPRFPAPRPHFGGEAGAVRPAPARHLLIPRRGWPAPTPTRALRLHLGGRPPAPQPDPRGAHSFGLPFLPSLPVTRTSTRLLAAPSHPKFCRP